LREVAGAVGRDRDQRTAAVNHRELLVREPIGLHVAQYRDREQSRRPHWPTPTLTLPRLRRREGRGLPARLVGAVTLRMRPTPKRPLSSCVINTVSQRPEAIAAAPASKMLCRRRGKGVRGRRAGNNLPLGSCCLIHLLLLEKNRPDSRNGCGSREMRLD